MNIIYFDPLPTSQDQLKSRYRSLCFKYHPDKHPQGDKQMKIINAEYLYLKGVDLKNVKSYQQAEDNTPKVKFATYNGVIFNLNDPRQRVKLELILALDAANTALGKFGKFVNFISKL